MKLQPPSNLKTIALAARRSAALLTLGLFCLGGAMPSAAQDPARWKAHDMKRTPPRVVSSALQLPFPPPSDAVVLFDGGDLSKWRAADGSSSKWIAKDGYMESVRGAGYAFSRDTFGDIQLHLEWASPANVQGNSQGRGNSGVFLMGLYEVQVLDSRSNRTYADGQAAAIYGQYPPLVNASRGPGEWQSYDIYFRRPRFKRDGRVAKPARATVVHNGVLVQDNEEIRGPTQWLQNRPYWPHPDRLPLSLQDHGNPVRYRNVWVRELDEWVRPGPTSDDTQPIVTMSENVLERYVGKYETAPGAFYEIKREGTQMFFVVIGPPKLELMTHSKKEFSLRWTAGRVVFDLDAKDRPTGLTFHLGGVPIKARKL